MAIVHHSRYLPLMEEARVAYLRHLGHPYSSIREAGIDLAVLEISVQYRKAMRFDDLVDVHVLLASIKRATFQMNYLMSVDGVPHAIGTTSHGAVTSDGKATRLPPWLDDLGGSTA
jgi:acyl-CoA thioester hydrolase